MAALLEVSNTQKRYRYRCDFILILRNSRELAYYQIRILFRLRDE